MTTNVSIHEHKIRCIGCNFHSTIGKCDCSNPDDREFLCMECRQESATQAWRRQPRVNNPIKSYWMM